MEVVSCDSHMTLCILYVNKCGWFVHVNLHVSCVHVCACVCLCVHIIHCLLSLFVAREQL